jgi:hypothetical protein
VPVDYCKASGSPASTEDHLNRYLITYDLLRPGKDYSSLTKELTRLGARRILLSVWTMTSASSAVQIRDHLARFVDANDRIWVSTYGAWAGRGLLAQPH